LHHKINRCNVAIRELIIGLGQVGG
jgi:hypothetical protein